MVEPSMEWSGIIILCINNIYFVPNDEIFHQNPFVMNPIMSCLPYKYDANKCDLSVRFICLIGIDGMVEWLYKMKGCWTHPFLNLFSSLFFIHLGVSHPSISIETHIIHYRWHQYWNSIFITRTPHQDERMRFTFRHRTMTAESRALAELEIGAYNGYIISLSSDKKKDAPAAKRWNIVQNGAMFV